MTTQTFNVPNISCHHCTNTIKRELEPLPGVTVVDASVENKQVTIGYADDQALARALSTLVEIGYPVAN
jgi:copper chaperone